MRHWYVIKHRRNVPPLPDVCLVVTLFKQTINSVVNTKALANTMASFIHDQTGCCIRVSHVSKAEAAKANIPVNFIGKESRKLLTHRGAIIDKVYTPAQQAEKALTCKAWDSFDNFWSFLAEGWPDHNLSTRREKSAWARVLGKEYVVAFADAVTNDAVTPYVHDSFHHIPDQIELHGDGWERSAEKLEAAHALRKIDYDRKTNKKAVVAQLLRLEDARKAARTLASTTKKHRRSHRNPKSVHV